MQFSLYWSFCCLKLLAVGAVVIAVAVATVAVADKSLWRAFIGAADKKAVFGKTNEATKYLANANDKTMRKPSLLQYFAYEGKKYLV